MSLHQRCPTYPIRAERAAEVSFDRGVDLEVPADVTTWIRIVMHAEGSALDVRELWIGPAQGVTKVDLTATEPEPGRASGRAIRVLCLDHELLPMRRAALRYGSTSRASTARLGEFDELQTVTSDDRGFAWIPVHEPTAIAVLAPGTRPDQGPPHAGRALARRGVLCGAMTLLAPERDRPVQFDVRCLLPERPGGHGALVATRMAGGAPTSVTLMPFVNAGRTHVTHRMPAGAWRLAVLPANRARVESSDDTLFLADNVADGEQPAPVGIRISAAPTTRVELSGIPAWQTPVEVGWQPQDETIHTPPGWRRLGASQWGAGGRDVPTRQQPVRLTALHKHATFLSGAGRVLAPPRTAFEMEPGCLVRFAWSDGGTGHGGGPPGSPYFLLADSAGWSTTVACRPNVSPASGLVGVAFEAEFVAPLGVTHLALLRPDGTEVWRRDVELATPRRRIRAGAEAERSASDAGRSNPSRRAGAGSRPQRIGPHGAEETPPEPRMHSTQAR